MIRSKGYREIEAEHINLKSKYDAKKIELKEIKAELDEAKNYVTRLTDYVNRLKKEKNDVKCEYDKLCNNCNDLLDWNNASDNEKKN